MRRRASLACCIVLAAVAARADDAGGLRMEIERSLGNDADALAEVLPRTIECIVAKQPERCGIKDFGLEHLTEARLRALFSGDRVVVSRSGRSRASGEIRVEFANDSGGEGGVIYFKKSGDVLVPVSVTLAIP